jgi:hypothetical protein
VKIGIYEIKPFANLCGANLTGANLTGATLLCANLRGANLYGANLTGANLLGANLTGANLHGADLTDATLLGATLLGADLRGANLHGADLRGAKNISALVAAQTSICAEGTIRGYKKASEGIVVLEIPAEAARSNANGRKCRAEFARVLKTPGGKLAHSKHDPNFVYCVGETVRPDAWCTDRWQECAGGIHFFLTREEAEAYN